MIEKYPKAIYFVQKYSEYLSFVAYLLKLAWSGYILGLDVAVVGKDLPENVPDCFYHPGIWIEYSDGSFQPMGE